MRLRTLLIALVCAALVPMLGFAVLVSRDNARRQLSVTERGLRETAHAVARTVDKELESTIAALEALGETEPLAAGRLDAFRALCRRVVRSQGWISIMLFAPDGRLLMHAEDVGAAPVPPAALAAGVRRAVDEAHAGVSGLLAGAAPATVAVYVPVLGAGAERFVLSAVLSATDFGDMLRGQQFGPGTLAVLQDGDNVILARTQGEAEMVGRRVQNPSPGREGWVKSRVREGTEVYVAFATAPLSGWRVVLTVPASTVDDPVRRAMWQLLVGAIVAAAIAGLVAYAFGRRIAGAVGALVGIARAVEGGRPAERVTTGVKEIDAVVGQLAAAAELARAREQDAAASERRAHAIGDMARALNASPDLDSVLRVAVAAVGDLVQADSARIALVDDSGRLVLRYSTTPSTAMAPGFVITRGHGIGGMAWATGRPIRTDDFRADPRFSGDRYLSIAAADGIVSCMAVPIVTAGVVAGVIYANNFAFRPFTDEDERLIVTLAHHAAVAVDKARLLAAEHAARAEAEAASRGKDELLAMLGHELRNPLSAIASAVAVLGSPATPPGGAQRAREIIARQSAHLAHLVDDLLDVSRVTSGKIALDRRPVELGQAVRQCVAAMAASRRTEQHRVDLRLERVWADVDETRFEQIVSNLMGNALRFTPAGGEIEVSLRAVDGRAELCVRDSGVGIAAEMLPRVFDLFVQGTREVDRGPGGLGLGLTLVKRIAELHGGTARAESAGPGRGSVFTVTLPAIAPPLAPAPSIPAAAPAAPRQVLVVEDNADSREMLRLVLELAGHTVHEAADGLAGLSALGTLRPDVALIDIGLPGIDGFEVARQARQFVGDAVRLIALTGYGQPDDRRQALEAGFDAHLVKPVEAPALLAAIAAAARPRAAQDVTPPA